jgi:hypothetical protein
MTKLALQLDFACSTAVLCKSPYLISVNVNYLGIDCTRLAASRCPRRDRATLRNPVTRDENSVETISKFSQGLQHSSRVVSSPIKQLSFSYSSVNLSVSSGTSNFLITSSKLRSFPQVRYMLGAPCGSLQV